MAATRKKIFLAKKSIPTKRAACREPFGKNSESELSGDVFLL